MAVKNTDNADSLLLRGESAIPKSRLSRYSWVFAPMLVVFCLTLLFTFSYLQRRSVISAIQSQYDYAINSLNESGFDIAYDRIEFNALWPFKLVKIKNFKIYTLAAENYMEWNIPELEVDTGLWAAKQLEIKLSKNQTCNFGGSKYDISIGRYKITVEGSYNGLNNLIIKLHDIDISNLAQIGELSFAARKIAAQQINDEAPFLKTYFEIRNVRLNGLLNYPLSQDISRIYFNADIIGRFKKMDGWQSAVNDWLLRDGKIEIKTLTINWLPLILVGKGDVYFNDKLKPVVRLKTSSKALLDLINQMESKSWLDNKGAFVAKILLSSKAFKADPEDKYLTVSTPINYQDGQISVEKITIYK